MLIPSSVPNRLVTRFLSQYTEELPKAFPKVTHAIKKLIPSRLLFSYSKRGEVQTLPKSDIVKSSKPFLNSKRVCSYSTCIKRQKAWSLSSTSTKMSKIGSFLKAGAILTKVSSNIPEKDENNQLHYNQRENPLRITKESSDNEIFSAIEKMIEHKDSEGIRDLLSGFVKELLYSEISSSEEAEKNFNRGTIIEDFIRQKLIAIRDKDLIMSIFPFLSYPGDESLYNELIKIWDRDLNEILYAFNVSKYQTDFNLFFESLKYPSVEVLKFFLYTDLSKNGLPIDEKENLITLNYAQMLIRQNDNISYKAKWDVLDAIDKLKEKKIISILNTNLDFISEQISKNIHENIGDVAAARVAIVCNNKTRNKGIEVKSDPSQWISALTALKQGEENFFDEKQSKEFISYIKTHIKKQIKDLLSSDPYYFLEKGTYFSISDYHPSCFIAEAAEKVGKEIEMHQIPLKYEISIKINMADLVGGENLKFSLIEKANRINFISQTYQLKELEENPS